MRAGGFVRGHKRARAPSRARAWRVPSGACRASMRLDAYSPPVHGSRVLGADPLARRHLAPYPMSKTIQRLPNHAYVWQTREGRWYATATGGTYENLTTALKATKAESQRIESLVNPAR